MGHIGYICQQLSEGWNTNISESQLINNKNVNIKRGNIFYYEIRGGHLSMYCIQTIS